MISLRGDDFGADVRSLERDQREIGLALLDPGMNSGETDAGHGAQAAPDLDEPN